MKESLGLIAALLGVLQTIPYTIDIFRGKTKPHMYTYIVWSIVTTVVFSAQVSAGGGAGAWTTGIMAVFSWIVLLLSFTRGTTDITRFDTLLLIGALLTLIPWFFTKDPLLSVVLGTLIDVLAFIPTIRKTWNDPRSETLISYISNIVRHPPSILALSTYTITTVLFPTALFVMNVVLVSVMLIRRKTIAG